MSLCRTDSKRDASRVTAAGVPHPFLADRKGRTVRNLIPPLVGLSAVLLICQATPGSDANATLMASIPSHLMMLLGLNGIMILGNRLGPAEPLDIAHSAPNPIQRMTFGRSYAAVAACIIVLAPLSVSALPITSLVISEVMFNPSGADDQREWVEIYNGTGADIDLSGYSLGWGGGDYTTGTLQLSGVIGSGATFLTGGPLSDAGNGNPTFDQAVDFGPNLQNGGLFVDGVALFDTQATFITAATVPIDAVLYGIFNVAGLIDETGSPGAVDYLGFGNAGSSIELTDSGWLSQAAPTPGVGPVLTPEPGIVISLGMGLALLALSRNRAGSLVRSEQPI